MFVRNFGHNDKRIEEPKGECSKMLINLPIQFAVNMPLRADDNMSSSLYCDIPN